MSTRPRSTARRSGRDSAPALLAVTTTAAGAVRGATPQEPWDTGSPGPVVGSVCIGYGGLDLGVLAALGGGRIAWAVDPDPHITQILTARLPDVPNLGDVRAIDWTSVAPVDVITAGFPCLNVKLDLRGWSPKCSSGFVDDVQQWCGGGLCGDVLEQVPAGVAVGPVEPPAGAVVPQLGDRSAGSVRSEVLSPRRANLEDCHVGSAHGVLDANLVAGVLVVHTGPLGGRRCGGATVPARNAVSGRTVVRAIPYR